MEATNPSQISANEWQIETWPIEGLTPYDRNPRLHSDEQIGEIVASMREFGFTIPILAQPNGTIIAGHARRLAAIRIGLKEVPVIVARGWTDEQIRKYVIADNRLTEKGEWDPDLLRIELGDLDLMDVSSDDELASIGFTREELDALIGEIGALDTVSDTQAEITPDVPDQPVSRPGDLWILGGHRLISGDATCATTVEELFDGATPNLMVTDPPYGVDYDPGWRAEAGVNKNKKKMGRVENDLRADWSDAWALFPGDVVYVWHGALHASVVEASLVERGFEIRSQVIWAKDRFALSRGHYHWRHEPCFYAVRSGRKGNWQGDRSQSTVWEIPAREDGGHGHGTQKPVACMLRPILNHTSFGDAVYDPFLGSGTTLIAAEKSERKCYAVELDPRYVDVAVRRWQEYSGLDAVLAGSDHTFKEIEAERSNASEPRKSSSIDRKSKEDA